MASPQILGLCGSLRAQSVNRKLLGNAAACWPEATYVEGNLRLSLYDGDVEEASGVPADVQTLADQIKVADAVLIACPEYNKGVSGVLKNALDWVSRVDGAPWADKPVAIMSATAGRSGGERLQTMLRACLVPFRPNIITGPEVLVGAAFKEFDDTGKLLNDINAKALGELMDATKSAAGY